MGELESDALSDQLGGLVGQAKKIHAEPFQRLNGKLSSKLMRLRPSVRSFSLVSYNPETPQLGWSDLRCVDDVDRTLREEKLAKPGRCTPEKKLQSWLIRGAMQGDGTVKPLNDVLGGHYLFVSDELAINVSTSKRVVVDLLLVRVNGAGLAQMVNVELKYARAMQAFDQVISFRDVLESPTLQANWKEFSEIMTGQTFQWEQTKETLGIVVWPRSGNPERAQASEKQRARGYERVDLIGFHERYILECENLPAIE